MIIKNRSTQSIQSKRPFSTQSKFLYKIIHQGLKKRLKTFLSELMSKECSGARLIEFPQFIDQSHSTLRLIAYIKHNRALACGISMAIK